MEKGQFVKNIGPADAVEGLFLLEEASLQQAKNGPFWRLSLRDATGAASAKIWSPLSQEFPALEAGCLVRVRGRAGMFREQMQITVEALEVLPPAAMAAVNLADFMPASPFSPDAMWEELLTICRQEFSYRPWRALALAVFGDRNIGPRFRMMPAAKGVHHAYAAGLLEHTLGVARMALSMADRYPQLDRQTLLAGALFHDLGKIEEFSGGLANDYTDAGRLLGHMELGLELLAPHLAKSNLEPELIRHLKHLVLSHHGTPEFGAARLPQTAEALALHYADNIDAKMAQCRGLFEEMPAGEEGWTPYQPTLGRFMHRAARTPESPPKAEKARPRKVVEATCLSLLKV
ncbi:MAG: HD domain-containing protein [Desulfovibrionaceae bacterium]|nr:HD domain-containing protein [Desulfovibrionaceae bacterium]